MQTNKPYLMIVITINQLLYHMTKDHECLAIGHISRISLTSSCSGTVPDDVSKHEVVDATLSLVAVSNWLSFVGLSSHVVDGVDGGDGVDGVRGVHCVHCVHCVHGVHGVHGVHVFLALCSLLCFFQYDFSMGVMCPRCSDCLLIAYRYLCSPTLYRTYMTLPAVSLWSCVTVNMYGAVGAP